MSTATGRTASQSACAAFFSEVHHRYLSCRQPREPGKPACWLVHRPPARDDRWRSGNPKGGSTTPKTATVYDRSSISGKTTRVKEGTKTRGRYRPSIPGSGLRKPFQGLSYHPGAAIIERESTVAVVVVAASSWTVSVKETKSRRSKSCERGTARRQPSACHRACRESRQCAVIPTSTVRRVAHRE